MKLNLKYISNKLRTFEKITHFHFSGTVVAFFKRVDDTICLAFTHIYAIPRTTQYELKKKITIHTMVK